MLEVIPRFGFRVRLGIACEQGLRRRTLQDAYFSSPSLGVFAIADGMGGHQLGELAAQEALLEVESAMSSDTTIKTAKRYFEQPDLDARRLVLERLRRVVERAHLRVRRVAKERNEPQDIGTTLDLIWLLRHEAFIAHVGDSRAYLVRPNAVLQLTEDHVASVRQTFAAEEPHTTRRELTSLTQAIGIGESVSPDTLLIDLRRGDRLLLTTDGVWAAVNDELELGQLARHGDAPRAAKDLCTRAAQKSFDDRTVLLIEVVERLVRHQANDTDAMVKDIAPVAESALFCGLPWPRILTALSVGVYVQIERGLPLPPHTAGDRVAYIILEGLIRLEDGRHLGSGATVFAECLVGSEPRGEPPMCVETIRAIRIRRDDYQELCQSNPPLATELYRRLAEHLGRRLGR